MESRLQARREEGTTSDPRNARAWIRRLPFALLRVCICLSQIISRLASFDGYGINNDAVMKECKISSACKLVALSGMARTSQVTWRTRPFVRHALQLAVDIDVRNPRF